MKLFILGLFAATLFLAGPSIAYAQFSSDRSQETILDADSVSTENGVFTLIGQADVRQGDVRLLADKIQFYTEGGGNGLISASGFTRMVATGNFYYITPEQEVRGNNGTYTQANNSFIVTGDVVLLQDDSVVTGERLDYNLETREAQVAGDCKGRKCSKGRRVSIIIRSTDTGQGTN